MSVSYVIGKILQYVQKRFVIEMGWVAIVIAVCLGFACGPAAAAEFNVRVKSVAQITVDDDGEAMGYPLAVFYDSTEEEIYVVNGGSHRVVVYGPDFFPRASIGIGRDVGAPYGGEVMPNGQVYICQARTTTSRAPRITILNGAFFVDQDINLDEIPEAENFSPRSVAVSREGLIYVAGLSSRGVLVLDGEGTFLRRLEPMDTIRDRQALAEMAQQAEEEEKQPEDEQAISGENEGHGPEEAVSPADSQEEFIDIPAEFRPRGSLDEESAGPAEGLGPVRVNYVTVDSSGRLYLLSPETGKVYVYGPDETFLFSFGKKGGSPRQMSQPRALAIDEDRGVIYVVDYMRHTILAYDMSGGFLFEFGGRGMSPGWFNFPGGISVNRYGQVIVADQFNKRVQVLEVEQPGLFGMPKGKPAAATSPEGKDVLETTPSDASLPGQPGGEKEEKPAPDVEPPVYQEAGNEGPEVPAEENQGKPDPEVEEVKIPVVEIPGYPDNSMEEQTGSNEEITDQSGAGEAAPEASPGQPTSGGDD